MISFSIMNNFYLKKKNNICFKIILIVSAGIWKLCTEEDYIMLSVLLNL